MGMSDVDEKTVKDMGKRKIRVAYWHDVLHWPVNRVIWPMCLHLGPLFHIGGVSYLYLSPRRSYLWKRSLNCVRGVTYNEYLNGHEIGFLLLDLSKTVFFR